MISETPIKTIVIGGRGKPDIQFIFILFCMLIITILICLFRLWGFL